LGDLAKSGYVMPFTWLWNLIFPGHKIRHFCKSFIRRCIDPHWRKRKSQIRFDQTAGRPTGKDRAVLKLTPLALGCRVPHGCSLFVYMNVAAVFAPKKIYGCPGSVAFNRVPKLRFAATALTGLTDADIHEVPSTRLREVRRRQQIVPTKPDLHDCDKGGGTA